MAESIILSNGELAVTLDRFGGIDNLYFPYVGLENHIPKGVARHRLGLFVDGTQHWLDDGSWEVSQNYLPERLISKTTASNHWLGFTIEFQDFVDSELNVVARSIEVINTTNRKRSAKLYISQRFIISGADDGSDTAQYLSGAQSILHYKGRRSFLISGHNRQSGKAFDSFSVGKFGHFGKEVYAGVWRDSEDGQLSENTTECGRTDSILAYDLEFQAHDSARVEYFLVAGKSQNDCLRALDKFKSDGTTDRLLKTDDFWKHWIMPAVAIAEVKIAPEHRSGFLRSLLSIKSMTDRHGAILASLGSQSDLDHASLNCQIRDAAFTAMTLWKLGYIDEVKQFLRFAKDVLNEKGFLEPNYRPDGLVGANRFSRLQHGDEVLPISLDETATVLFLSAKVAASEIQRGERLDNWRDYYENLIKPAANFLCSYIDENTRLPLPSYDLAGSHHETSTYQVATAFGALEAATKLARLFGDNENYTKWQAVSSGIRDISDRLWNETTGFFYRGCTSHDDHTDYYDDIDFSAFYGAWAFGLFDKDHLKTASETLAANNYSQSEESALPIELWVLQYRMYNGESMESDDLTKYASRVAGHCWANTEFINACLAYNKSRGGSS